MTKKLSERMRLVGPYENLNNKTLRVLGNTVHEWADEVAALEQRVERQAEHITHTDGSIENRNEKVRKWKRLHNELGKKYATLKQRAEGLEKAFGTSIV